MLFELTTERFKNEDGGARRRCTYWACSYLPLVLACRIPRNVCFVPPSHPELFSLSASFAPRIIQINMKTFTWQHHVYTIPLVIHHDWQNKVYGITRYSTWVGYRIYYLDIRLHVINDTSRICYGVRHGMTHRKIATESLISDDTDDTMTQHKTRNRYIPNAGANIIVKSYLVLLVSLIVSTVPPTAVSVNKEYCQVWY